MRQHLLILKGLLETRGVEQQELADALGLKSPSAAGMKLRGERGMTREELRIMCEKAGITIMHLASVSDDLVLTKYPETAEGAAILDDLDDSERAAAMLYLRHVRDAKLNKK